MLGTVVGSYRITGQIAVGGMGTVYRAEHTLIGRIAAIKVLHPEMTTSREIVTRFFNEAKATSGIKHPGIVEVFDFGYMPSGHAYLVMEFLEGETLSQRMRQRGIVSEGEAAMLMRGVCSALAAAHAKGVVHRDLKPDNIFIVPEPDSPLGERTKILDFGIAKLTEIGEGNQHTKAGAVMGTPTYMSPEQCRGTGEVDHRADLYSIGCMLYELVIGRTPFMQTGAGELLGAHLFVDPEPPSRHGRITPELEALVMQLLEKKPERRVQTAIELGNLLIGIARSSGWVTAANTDPGRYSMQHFAPGSQFTPMGHPAPEFTPHHLTPAGRMTPAQLTPAQLTPAQLTPAHLTPGVVHYTPMQLPPQAPTTIAPPPPEHPKPTTLSGSASEQHPAATKSRRGLTIAISTIVFAAAAGIAFFIATSGHKDEIQPVTEPTTGPVVIQPTTDTKPVDTKPVETKPVDTNVDTKPVDTNDAKPVDTNPVDTKSVDTKPVDTKPVDTKSVDTKPVDTKSVDTKPADTKSVDTKPVGTKPADKKTTKSTDKKTTKSTDKKTTKSTDKKPDKEPGDLLETDID